MEIVGTVESSEIICSAERNMSLFTCEADSSSELMKVTSSMDVDHGHHVYDQFGRSPAHKVAMLDQENAVPKIQSLVEDGADINARELRTGNTILHIAAQTRNYQLAEWLCKQPSMEKDAVNFNYDTAYRIAYKARDLKMMLILRHEEGTFPEIIVCEFFDGSSCDSN